MNHALINHKLLHWARERRNITYVQLARSLNVGIEVVGAWERGDSYPSFAKAQSLAKALRIPFGYLFLSKPPSDDAPLPDFRTVGDRRNIVASPDFLALCNQVLRKQEWYREYSEQISAKPLSFIGRFRIDSGIAAVAENIKDSLSIDAALRHSCNDWSGYLTQLSRKAQQIGILVMRSGIVGSDTKHPLDVAEFRGFAITDSLAPIVSINSRDAIAAQIFTLLHEIAHVWIGQSGISNPDPTQFTVHRSEKFCNAVSAEVLLPKDEFVDAWDASRRRDDLVVHVARTFWVSTLVTLRRAYDLEMLGREEFFHLVEAEKEKQLPKRRRSGGNSLVNILARNSQILTSGVLRALRDNQLLYMDAAQLLGVKAATLPHLIKKQDAL